MQCSASRPTSSASTSVRPASSSTRWNSRGPSPSRTPVHSDVYGFIRSAVDERGSSCRNTSRSRHSGSTFSIPITVTSTRGQRHAHAAVALGLDDADRARLGHGEVRARHGDRARERNFARRCRRAASAIADASLPSDGPGRSCARTARGSPPGCGGWPARGCATACRGRAGRSAPPGRSRSALMPRSASASFRPISSVASDLTLITSSLPWARAMSADDRVRLGAVARPVHDAAGPRSPPPPAARAARAAWPSRAP